jgi:cytosine/adenosine deaminase-related metal-dependent hydrolase
MLTAGVSVAIGTDSRASNPDLKLFEELRFLATHHPAVSPAKILELGTLAGARALGRGEETGSLTAGKLADLCVLPLATANSIDPYAMLWESTGETLETWSRGCLVFARQAAREKF